MKTIRTVSVSKLVEDDGIYPRMQIDSGHVQHLVAALKAKTKVPSLLIDRKTWKVVDGRHTKAAWVQVYGYEVDIPCEVQDFVDDAAMLLEAMRRNVGHGRALTNYDKTCAMQKATSLNIEAAMVATALNMTREVVANFQQTRLAFVQPGHRPVPLKQPIRHMAGMRMTVAQTEVIPKLGGNNQLFYVNQLITLLESGLFDWTNEYLVAGLDRLVELASEKIPTTV
jgi:hypothetical protein